jgi:hypothetical protein
MKQVASKALLDFQQTTQHYIPEDRNLHTINWTENFPLRPNFCHLYMMSTANAAA